MPENKNISDGNTDKTVALKTDNLLQINHPTKYNASKTPLHIKYTVKPFSNQNSSYKCGMLKIISKKHPNRPTCSKQSTTLF